MAASVVEDEVAARESTQAPFEFAVVGENVQPEGDSTRLLDFERDAHVDAVAILRGSQANRLVANAALDAVLRDLAKCLEHHSVDLVGTHRGHTYLITLDAMDLSGYYKTFN